MAKKKRNRAENGDNTENDAGTATATADAPTVETRRNRTPEPEGQTAASSGVTGGGATDAEFSDEVSRVDNLGRAAPTRVNSDGEPVKEKAKVPSEFTSLAKGLGLRSSDILSYNERSRTAVFSNGGKYQLSKNGKTVRRLAGPEPPRNINLDVQDARQRSPFVGTAAAINGPAVVEDEDPMALRDEKAALESRIAEINSALGDEESDEE